jgi:UDP-N-acetylmuramyl pentapeptide phosphotransferase/UDP-N-acetylglucosamine-1-phosphate transferase
MFDTDFPALTNLWTLMILMVTSYGGLYLILRMSIKNRWFDVPIERSSHSRIVPRTAGISIAFIAMLSLVFVGPSSFKHPLILFAYLIFFIVGIYDDIKHMKASNKFWIQLIVSTSLAVFLPNFRINHFYGILGLGSIGEAPSIVFTAFVFIVVINAYNLIDGVDGLALSFSIFAIFLISRCYTELDNSIATFGLSLASILIPFYFFNFSRKRKMFLGDTGSLFLGTTIFLFVGYFLNANNKVVVPCDMNRAIYALVALCYPLLDTLRVFTLRLTRGQSPFTADRSHIHHKLLGLGFSHTSTTISLLFFNVLIYMINCSLLRNMDVNAVIVADFLLIGLFFIGGLWYTRLFKK